jgi:hypothetical protein
VLVSLATTEETEKEHDEEDGSEHATEHAADNTSYQNCPVSGAVIRSITGRKSSGRGSGSRSEY